MASTWKIDEGFDLEAFLARPLVARLATTGPFVRPLWFLWEDGAFWWLTGPWSKLREHLARDPNVALVVDHTDVATGEVKIVTARGGAEVVAWDADRAKRKFTKYLGRDVAAWDPRFLSSWDPAFRTGCDEDPDGFGRLVPRTLVASDRSYLVPGKVVS
jgi:nitroimidazol reductase NimA-like FMN-containing flavoprotein (pyridoxamine 5'-phosphate oxidase superfamily)